MGHRACASGSRRTERSCSVRTGELCVGSRPAPCRPSEGGDVILAIDIGNTETMLGLFDGNEVADSWRLSTERHRTGDELFLQVRRVASRPGPKEWRRRNGSSWPPSFPLSIARGTRRRPASVCRCSGSTGARSCRSVSRWTNLIRWGPTGSSTRSPPPACSGGTRSWSTSEPPRHSTASRQMERSSAG